MAEEHPISAYWAARLFKWGFKVVPNSDAGQYPIKGAVAGLVTEYSPCRHCVLYYQLRPDQGGDCSLHPFRLIVEDTHGWLRCKSAQRFLVEAKQGLTLPEET